MYQTQDFRATYHTPNIWRAGTNPSSIQNQQPRPSVDLTADGFFAPQPQAQAPLARPAYDHLSNERPGPSAQDDFEMQLDAYFDDGVPATVARRASEFDAMLAVHPRVLPPFPPVPRPSCVDAPRALASTSTVPPSPPCDADFAFYGDQRDYLFFQDNNSHAHTAAYSNEPVLVRSRFGPGVPTPNEGMLRRSARVTRSELTSKEGTVNGCPSPASHGSPKKSSGQARNPAVIGKSSTRTRRRKDDATK